MENMQDNVATFINDISGWAYSREAEQSLIGALLIDNAAFDKVTDLVNERAFFFQAHRAAFRAIAELIQSSNGADVVTVAERLEAKDAIAFKQEGGVTYLAGLAQNTPSSFNIKRYADLIRERFLMRELYAASQQIAESVVGFKGRPVGELVDHAQSLVMAVGDRSVARRDFQPASEVLKNAYEFIDEQHMRYVATGNEVVGVPTGFLDLDKNTAGLHPGQLVIIAARPSMGKSALALGITEHASRATKRWALVFTLEMGNREQGLRLIASKAHVNVQRLVSGRVYDAEWPRVTDSIAELHELKILFNDQASLTVMDMRSLARRAMRDFPGGLSLIAVDYLQLMLSGDTDANRANQIAEISRGLKLLAMELQIPVVALSQLSREVEKRTNKRPILSDLRDSGALEQDADVVLFIYRDEVYHPNTEDKGIAEIIIGKQRNGPVGTVRLTFHADRTRFENYAGYSHHHE